MQYFVRFISPSSAETDNGWGGKLKSFDGQFYQEYSYQNLLKLDHFSSSYDEKNFGVFFMPHSVVWQWMNGWTNNWTNKKTDKLINKWIIE